MNQSKTCRSPVVLVVVLTISCASLWLLSPPASRVKDNVRGANTVTTVNGDRSTAPPASPTTAAPRPTTAAATSLAPVQQTTAVVLSTPSVPKPTCLISPPTAVRAPALHDRGVAAPPTLLPNASSGALSGTTMPAPQAIRRPRRLAHPIELPEGPHVGDAPMILGYERPPHFPVSWEAPKAAGDRWRGVAKVPSYVSVLNDFTYVEAFMRTSANVTVSIVDNATHLLTVSVTPILFDNTGCHRQYHVVRRERLYFQNHAEKMDRVDCDEFFTLIDRLKADIGLEVLRPMVPLGFGPTRNAIQQDALEVRKVPRFINSHNDAGLRTTGNLEVLLAAAVVFRQPYYVVFTHYDIVALYDAWVLEQYVGDWDEHLWYYGDIDYFGRGRTAGLPSAEAGGGGVDHLGGGSVALKKLDGKAAALLHHENQINSRRKEERFRLLSIEEPDALPGTSWHVHFSWHACDDIDIIRLTRQVSDAFSRWMVPKSIDLWKAKPEHHASLRCSVWWSPLASQTAPIEPSVAEEIAKCAMSATGAHHFTFRQAKS